MTFLEVYFLVMKTYSLEFSFPKCKKRERERETLGGNTSTAKDLPFFCERGGLNVTYI